MPLPGGLPPGFSFLPRRGLPSGGRKPMLALAVLWKHTLDWTFAGDEFAW